MDLFRLSMEIFSWNRLLEYRTVQLTLNVTYTPDLQNASSNASQQLLALINQTLTTSLINVTVGGFRPDLISFLYEKVLQKNQISFHSSILARIQMERQV